MDASTHAVCQSELCLAMCVTSSGVVRTALSQLLQQARRMHQYASCEPAEMRRTGTARKAGTGQSVWHMVPVLAKGGTP